MHKIISGELKISQFQISNLSSESRNLSSEYLSMRDFAVWKHENCIRSRFDAFQDRHMSAAKFGFGITYITSSRSFGFVSQREFSRYLRPTWGDRQNSRLEDFAVWKHENCIRSRFDTFQDRHMSAAKFGFGITCITSSRSFGFISQREFSRYLCPT